jgi:cytoskeletal protein CcmA (bactofilin family)
LKDIRVGGGLSFSLPVVGGGHSITLESGDFVVDGNVRGLRSLLINDGNAVVDGNITADNVIVAASEFGGSLTVKTLRAHNVFAWRNINAETIHVKNSGKHVSLIKADNIYADVVISDHNRRGTSMFLVCNDIEVRSVFRTARNTWVFAPNPDINTQTLHMTGKGYLLWHKKGWTGRE